MIELAIICATATMITALITEWVRRLAIARGILDRPNVRSSHTQPTPRGGGVAIVVVCMAALPFLFMMGLLDIELGLALFGGVAIACIGFIDDRRSVSPQVRFAVHVASAIWAVYILGGLPPIQIGKSVVDLGVPGDLITVVAITWVVNLFNFMDGIDGIAASEAILIAVGGSVIGFAVSGATGISAISLVFAAACLGFLLLNWPPARIFMGDAGSGFLGYFLAVLAIGSARQSPVVILAWLILGGAFFVDATITLLRRVLRRVRIYQPHREHAYQWLSRRWRSHLAVDVLLIAINVGWLLPCAWYAASHPEIAGLVTLIALLPLVPLAIVSGAGRSE